MPWAKKLLGRWPKIGLFIICLPLAALFSSNLSVFCQFTDFLDLFSIFKNILFINFRDLDIQKSSQYRLSTSHKSQQSNCFSTKSGDFYYLWLKSTQILEVGCMNTRWKLASLKLLTGGKKANLPQFGALSLLHH